VRTAPHVIWITALMLLVFTASLLAGKQMRHEPAPAQLDVAAIARNPAMGIGVAVDEDGIVQGASDSSAVGRQLDWRLSSLALRARQEQACQTGYAGRHEVNVCVLDPQKVRPKDAAQLLDIDVDGKRTATAQQLMALQARPQVRRVTLIANRPPILTMRSGAQRASSYSPFTSQQLEKLMAHAHRPPCKPRQLCIVRRGT
jgi:hypothetical protein